MAIAVSQERATQNSATGTTIALAYSSACTVGSTFHAAGSCDTSGAVTISNFSDGTNGTWPANLNDINDTGNAQRHGHAAFTNNASSGTPTVTCTFSATASARGIAIKEITGGVTTAPDTHTGQDQTSVGTGTDAISSGNATNANQPALISAFTLNTATTSTTASTGTGFTTGAAYWSGIYGTGNKGFSESERITTTTAKAATYTASGSGLNWITLMAVFDEASAGAATGRQTDWPNPVIAKPNHDLRGWIQSPIPSPNAIPPHQSDWPNPVLPKPNYDLRGWIQDPIPTPNAIPNHQSDWPNPAPLKPNLELRNWIQAPIPNPQVPFFQTDWPNPNLGKPYPYDLRGWIQDPLPAPNPIPPSQTDWPNPQPLKPNLELRSWIQDPIPVPTPILIRQNDWPNPQLPRRSIDSLTWVWSFPPILFTPPINQFDWPNPNLGKPFPSDLRGWIQSPQPSPQAIPNHQSDWPNPLPLRRSVDSLTWVWSIAPSLTANFSQYDWPNPIIARASTERGWIQSPQPSPQTPFRQSDWQNPAPLPQNLELRSWIRAPQPSPQSIPNAQLDWPNPAPLARNRELFTWSQFILQPTPPPVGPVMPNLFGLNYYMALKVLQAAGVYVPQVVYKFNITSISVTWAKTGFPGGIVTAQSIAAGLSVVPNSPITLTVSMYPFGADIDSPPDWRQ